MSIRQYIQVKKIVCDPDLVCLEDGWIKPESPYTPPVPIIDPTNENEIVLLSEATGSMFIRIRASLSAAGNVTYTTYDLYGNVLEAVTVAHGTVYHLDMTLYPSHIFFVTHITVVTAAINIVTLAQMSMTGFITNWPIRYVKYNTPYLNTLANIWRNNTYLQRVDFMSDLNAVDLATNVFEGTKIPYMRFPAMDNCTSLASAFANNTVIYKLIFPTTLPKVTTLASLLSGATAMSELYLPQSMPELTNMQNMCYNATAMRIIKLPLSMPKLNSITQAFRPLTLIQGDLLFPDCPLMSTGTGAFSNCGGNKLGFLFGNQDAASSDWNNMFYGVTADTVIMPKTMNAGAVNMNQTFWTAKCKHIIMPDVFLINTTIAATSAWTNTTELLTIKGDCDFPNGGSFGVVQILTTTLLTMECPKMVVTNLIIGTNGGKLTKVDIDYENSAWAAGICINLRGDLSSAEIDRIFTALPSIARTIDVRYNTGYAGCDPSIATAKGWTVL
jgi:hypothetical protein